MVEHSAVNRRVASSNLARGAKSSFSFSKLQTAILTIHQRKSQCHIGVIQNGSLDRDAFAIHLLICFLHRFTNFLDHAELIPALRLGAGVTHRPLNHSIRRYPT
jgi:hypothetical protein